MITPGAPLSPVDLLSALPAKFEQGRSSGELLFFESSAEDVNVDGRRFNVRLCPALADKAKAKSEVLAQVRAEKEGGSGSPDAKRQRTESEPEPEPQQSKQNSKEPFKPPYVPELFAGALQGIEGEANMSVLLNKYSLLPHHFLLCPQTSQPQSTPPSPAQLALAYTLLLASSTHPTRPHRLLAFYNSNPTAGASQPWRHIQFIEPPAGVSPLEEWCGGIDPGARDRAFIHPALPYVHVMHPLPADELRRVDVASEKGQERLVDALAPAVMRCLDLAIDSLRRMEGVQETGWNLLMTLEYLHLVPRVRPSCSLPEPHAPLEVNALGYAGYMLVKSDEEREALSRVEGGLPGVLTTCGVPRVHGEDAEKAMEKVHNGGEMF